MLRRTRLHSSALPLQLDQLPVRSNGCASAGGRPPATLPTLDAPLSRAMSIITLQVGQAGCQCGAALFQQLAAEALAGGSGGGSGGGEWSEAADRFFHLASAGGGPAK